MKKTRLINIFSLIFNLLLLAAVIIPIVILFSSGMAVLDIFLPYQVAAATFIGLAAFICLILNIVAIVKDDKLPLAGSVLKLMGATVGVMVPLFAILMFVVHQIDGFTGDTLFDLLIGSFDFKGEAIYLRLIVPALALLSYILFDHSKKVAIPFFFLGGLVPALYFAFYIVNSAAKIVPWNSLYDWYSVFGGQLGYVFVGGFIVLAFIVALLLLLLNRLFGHIFFPKKKEEEPKEAPKQEERVTAVPVDDDIVNAIPVEEEKAEEEPKEQPVEEPKQEEATPVEQPQEEEIEEEAAPKEEPVAEEKPVEEEKVEETPAEQPQEEQRAEETPVEQPQEEQPAEEPKEVTAPAEEEPKEEKPAKKAPAKKPAAKKPAAKKAPAKKKTEEKKPAAKKAPAKKKTEEKETKVYHLTKRKEDGKWAITFVGGQKAVKLFKTKKEAEEYLKTLTENQGATALIRNSKGAKAGKFASSIKAEENK